MNGFFVVRFGIPAFIMTLGVLVMGEGVAFTLSQGRPISVGDAATSFYWLGGGQLLGLPVPVWIFLAVSAVAAFVLRYTPYGRYVYAVGDNSEAARLSGIRVGLIQSSVFVISGLLAALTALIYVSRLTVGDPQIGTGLELEAIAGRGHRVLPGTLGPRSPSGIGSAALCFRRRHRRPALWGASVMPLRSHRFARRDGKEALRRGATASAGVDRPNLERRSTRAWKF